MADGYARRTGQPQCVIVHVDVGTQALGPAFHNAASGRAPVLVLAGATPFTQDGELKGSRSEFINWYQDVPDQRAIVAQYCRHTAEIRSGRNIKQVVLRALQFAASEPQGPVYLMAAREVLEEEVPRVDIVPEHWNPLNLGALPGDAVVEIAEALATAERPLVVAGFIGRNPASVASLVSLAHQVPGLRVHDSSMSEMTFPATHPARLTPTGGAARVAVQEADVILILDADVPWIPATTHPRQGARIFHIDADPLKQRMQLFYIPATRRYLASARQALEQLTNYLSATPALLERLAEPSRADQKTVLQQKYAAKCAELAHKAHPPAQSGRPATVAYLSATLKSNLPSDTIWVSEAVSNHIAMADQLAAELPGSFVTKAGSGLGWNGGGALGVKLAADDQLRTQTTGEKGAGAARPFVCNITGDGSFLFSHPSAVAWIAAHYKIPVLTVVLNNGGWRAPRASATLVSPDGLAAKQSTDPAGMSALGIGFGERHEQPRFAGIAAEASAGWMVGERVERWEDVVGAVKRGRGAVAGQQRGCVLDVWIE